MHTEFLLTLETENSDVLSQRKIDVEASAKTRTLSLKKSRYGKRWSA